MSAFDIPFTKLTEMPALEPEPKVRKAPVKRGANPTPRGQPSYASKLAAEQAAAPADRTPPRSVNWKVGEYKPNSAMKAALARAREAQPPLIAMSGSTTDGQPKDWAK